MRKLTAITLYCLLGASVFAQDLSQNFKNWYLTSLNVKLSKANTLSIGHLSSFDVDDYERGFMQNKLSLSHRFSKRWSASVGYAHSVIYGSNDRRTTFQRGQASLAHRSYFGKFRMDNSLQVEQYFPQLPKYGTRIVLSNKLRYYNKDWPLRLSPYLKNQFYYYQGGDPIQYVLEEEDWEDGELPFIEQSPNGWHRYRFTAGARARLAPYLYLSIFYAVQREFNTGLAPFREIHVPNESETQISQRFNNYALLGVSLSYTLKLN